MSQIRPQPRMAIRLIGPVLALGLVVSACAREQRTGTASLAGGKVSCAQARQILHDAGYQAPMPCQKALFVARQIAPNAFPQVATPTPTDSGGQSPSFLPTPSPQPPGNQREVVTGGIGQWAPYDFAITSLWLDLENGLNVDVEGGADKANLQQGRIIIGISDQNTSDSGSFGNYAGGQYDTPSEVGALTLTDVTGSLATADMMIYFSYEGEPGRWTH